MTHRSSQAPVVLKFGGGVLGDGSDLRRVVAEIARRRRDEGRVIVVVSALRGRTDFLDAEARSLGLEGAARCEWLARGEEEALALLLRALAEAGVDAVRLGPAEVALAARGPRDDAWPESLDPRRFAEALDAGRVVLFPGFVARHEDGGGVALLGRGGSDLTAVFLAERLRARACVLYKRAPAGEPAAGLPAVPAVQAKAIRFARGAAITYEVRDPFAP